MSDTKKCTKCKEVKQTTEFSKWSRGKDGLQNYCKVCNRKYLKKFNIDYLPNRREEDQTKTGSYLNHIWLKMLKRCNNPNETHYHNYGGRGIKVCERWHDWNLFLEDMLEGYEMGLSIERIDVNGDYCPENCKWITKREQAFNKQDTIYVTTPDGSKVSLTQHAYDIDFSRSTAYDRFVRYGDDYEKIFAGYVHRKWCYEDEIKIYISKNMNAPTKDVIRYVEENFGQTLTSQYIRQIKSDWKTGKPKSIMLKLLGPYEDFVNESLTPQPE